MSTHKLNQSKPYLIDTHAHLQAEGYKDSSIDPMREAFDANIEKIICVGVDLDTSIEAVEIAKNNENIFAAVGLHPHEAKHFDQLGDIKKLISEAVVGVGECGLDYYYQHSPRQPQIEALKVQLQWAKDFELPLSIHLRGSKDNPNDAFDDFWPLWDEVSGLSGTIHSFSSSEENMKKILKRGLYISLNGIVTFNSGTALKTVVERVPIERLLLESDAPLLTPSPFRGKINQPKYVEATAKIVAETRGLGITTIHEQTSKNAEALFGI